MMIIMKEMTVCMAWVKVRGLGVRVKLGRINNHCTAALQMAFANNETSKVFVQKDACNS